MKSTISFVLFLWVVPTFLLSNTYELKRNISEIPFKIVNDLILVEARINKQKGHFLFDTGAADLTLNLSHFKGKSWPAQQHQIADINGLHPNPYKTKVNCFALGDLERHQFNVPVIDLSIFEKEIGLPLLGLIGYEVFKEVEIVFDYNQRKLHLIQLDAFGQAVIELNYLDPDYYFDINVKNSLPIINGELEGKTLRLAFDSGSAVNIIDSRFKRQLLEDAAQIRNIRLGGAFSESQEMPIGTFTHIVFEDQLAVKWWRAAFHSLNHLTQVDIYINGILGVNFLRYGVIALNYKQKTMRLWNSEDMFKDRFFSTLSK